MTEQQRLHAISSLSSVIGLLEGKWERPHSELETAILKTLLDLRETIRSEHEQDTARRRSQGARDGWEIRKAKQV